jgi:hypothetical protein
VRDALHQAAEAEGFDFPELGPHSFRRATDTKVIVSPMVAGADDSENGVSGEAKATKLGSLASIWRPIVWT